MQEAPTASIHRWKDIEPEQLNPQLTRQFVTGSQAMLSRIVLLRGCLVPSHSHHNEQLAFILDGALKFTLADGTTHIVRSGEVLVIPANVAHSAEALEDTINFDIFAPPRQDWIDKDDRYLRG
jgi:quercetin dioxygenase-like cupin family protein